MRAVSLRRRVLGVGRHACPRAHPATWSHSVLPIVDGGVTYGGLLSSGAEFGGIECYRSASDVQQPSFERCLWPLWSDAGGAAQRWDRERGNAAACRLAWRVTGAMVDLTSQYHALLRLSKVWSLTPSCPAFVSG
jgi:hypothetical protein